MIEKYKVLDLLKALYWMSIKSPLLYYWRNLRIHIKSPNSRISYLVIWDWDNIHSIIIGDNTNIGAFSEIVVYKNTSYSKQQGFLEIGDFAIIGSGANIRAMGGKIRIGKNSLIGQQVSLIASNHSTNNGLYREATWDETITGIEIQENVWIGSGVTILPGCIIGKNSVVGAGSVVTRNIPPNEIWVGIPAKKLKNINRSDKETITL